MAVDMNKLVKLQALDMLAAKVDTKVNSVETKADNSFKGAKVVNGNTIELYTGTDTTVEATLTLELPAERVIDTTKTVFVSNFNFENGNYTGANNPNLDGNAVLVIAVKTVDKGIETTEYSFVDINYLVDPIEISEETNNSIELKNDGLFVDISGKQDKDTDATANNIAQFDAAGNAVDAGIAADDILLMSDIATDAEVNEMLDTYLN